MAVAQKNKIRPITNLSTPAGTSFNEAIRPESVQKLEMSSAKLFVQGIVRARKSANINLPSYNFQELFIFPYILMP